LVDSNNIVWQATKITREQHQQKNQHKSCVLWFTGLSGSGKSTLAYSLEERLFHLNCSTTVLDGDNIRHGLCRDLGFSLPERQENLRRVGQVSKLFMDTGLIVLSAFISPMNKDRKNIRANFQENDFIEIYCQCDLNICEQRDIKGLYKKARKGEIKDFTGISSPYESPENAEIIIDTAELTVTDSVEKIITYLDQQNILPSIKHASQ
jgi:adenylylsulfate kinase